MDDVLAKWTTLPNKPWSIWRGRKNANIVHSAAKWTLLVAKWTLLRQMDVVGRQMDVVAAKWTTRQMNDGRKKIEKIENSLRKLKKAAQSSESHKNTWISIDSTAIFADSADISTASVEKQGVQ